jgi:hypothetical protein
VRLLSLAIFFLAFNGLWAQSVSTVMGARSLALGRISSLTDPLWGSTNNPACLAKAELTSAAFAYEVATLPGANRLASAFIKPLNWGTWGLSAFRFGDEIYNEQLVSISFANQLGIASLGGRISYVQYSAEGFGTSRGVAMDFGGVAQLTPQLSIGAYITNLTRSQLNTLHDDPLPTRLFTSMQFTLSEKVLLLTEVEKDIDFDAIWRAGFEWDVYKKIFFRTGYQLPLRTVSFGLGTVRSRLSIDYAFQWQRISGTSHQASASYRFQRSQK